MDTILLAGQFLGKEKIAPDVPLKSKGLPLDGNNISEPLRNEDIWKATETWNDAFIDDPMMNYINCDEPPSKSKKLASRVILSTGLALWIKTKRALTVDHGQALLISTPPEDFQHPIHRKLDRTFTVFLRLLSRFSSSESKKRHKEAETKMETALQEVIGDHAKTMWYIDLVCTNPKRQGRGYGSALLNRLKKHLDLEERSAWLSSSNIANEPFYNFHGFFSVADIYLGGDNPDWDRKPVKVQIMVRPPATVGRRVVV